MSEDTRPSARSVDTKRGSRSDRTLPGLPFIATLVSVVAIALLFIGYRVFDIESQRRDINLDLRLLDDKEKDVAEAKQQHYRLQQLQREVGAAQGTLQRLQSEEALQLQRLATQKHTIDSHMERIDADLKRIGEDEDRIANLTAEEKQLADRIESNNRKAEQAQQAANLAQSRSKQLDAGVRKLEAERLELRTRVSELQARRDAIVKVNTELPSVFERLENGARSIDSTAHSLQATVSVFESLTLTARTIDDTAQSLRTTATALESTTTRDLNALSRRLTDTADRIELAAEGFQGALLSLTNEKAPLENTREQLEQTARAFATMLQDLSKSMREAETQLTHSTTEIASTATRLPAMDDDLTDSIRNFASSIEDFQRTTQKSTQDLSGHIARIAREHETQLKSLTESVGRLDRATRAFEELDASRVDSGTPPLEDEGPPADPTPLRKELE